MEEYYVDALTDEDIIQLNSAQAIVDASIEQDAFRCLVALVALIVAIAGLIANVFVVTVSFSKSHGDYRLFVANLAVVDCFCAVLFAFMGYINLLYAGSVGYMSNRFPTALLSHAAFAFYGSFGVMVCALVPIALSRVIAASRPKTHAELFTGWRAVGICAIADSVPCVLLMSISAVSSVDMARCLFFVYASLTGAAYAATFLLNLLVVRLVASHIHVAASLRDRTRLVETRQVAFATLAQALVPLVCQVPAFLALSSALLLIRAPDGRITVLTQLWLAASPLLDALITLSVIRPYRRQTTNCVNSTISRLRRCARFSYAGDCARQYVVHCANPLNAPPDDGTAATDTTAPIAHFNRRGSDFPQTASEFSELSKMEP